ncbi:unnamed protein product [Amaranthus hypochondriacus]
MGFSLITPSTSSLSYFSSPMIKKPIYPPKITKNLGFSRSRIVVLSSASPEWVPSNSDIITPTVGESPNSQNPESSNDPLTNPNGKNFVKNVQSAESSVERFIFDFRFLALLAIGGSLAGSVLCFLNGCVYVYDAYNVYLNACLKGVHTGKMVLRLVEAIDVYLAGTVMLVFALGLYELFISNASANLHPKDDPALTGSSLFGMFALKERPRWMKVSSLDELKTKVGHVIVMILLVKMFERSKMVTIATGYDLLSYACCIFLSSASLYILNLLHKTDENGDHE